MKKEIFRVNAGGGIFIGCEECGKFLVIAEKKYAHTKTGHLLRREVYEIETLKRLLEIKRGLQEEGK